MAVDYTAALGNFATGIIIIVVLAILVFIGFLWYNRKQYSTKILIREVINGRTIIRDAKARLLEKESGNKFYEIKYRKNGLGTKKEKIPVPDSKALDIQNDGNKFMEVYRTEDGDYIPLTFNGPTEDELGESYEPFTSHQRGLLVNEIRHAEEYGDKSWQEAIKENLPVAIAAFMVVGIAIFLPDIIQEFNTVTNSLGSVADKLGDTVTKVDALVNDKQIVEANQTENITRSARRTVSG